MTIGRDTMTHLYGYELKTTEFVYVRLKGGKLDIDKITKLP